MQYALTHHSPCIRTYTVDVHSPAVDVAITARRLLRVEVPSVDGVTMVDGYGWAEHRSIYEQSGHYSPIRSHYNTQLIKVMSHCGCYNKRFNLHN